MQPELRNIIVKHVIEYVEGGVCKSIEELIDLAIEDGHLSEEDYRTNEMEICYLIDDHIFNCVACGWTMPIECLDDTEAADMRCTDCAE